MNPGEFSRELEVACAAARAAGRAAMRFYGSAEATYKEGLSPVTAADHAANDVILAQLAEAFPGDAWLSEESADRGDRAGASRVWIIDPLDGTKEFLAQNGEFSVMIGLAVDGAAVVGAVYAPATDTLYGAARGAGAWVERGGQRSPLRIPGGTAGAPRLVGSRSHPDPLVIRIQETLGITDVRPSGSVGIKCALIAEGDRDLYIHPVPYLKEWDTCAPEVVLREAGGTVTDCRGEPLRYNKERTNQPYGIVASAPAAADALPRVLEICARVGAAA